MRPEFAEKNAWNDLLRLLGGQVVRSRHARRCQRHLDTLRAH